MGKVINYLRLSPLYEILFPLVQKYEFYRWTKRGKTLQPPHFIKQSLVRSYALVYSCDILVETGTYFGSMVNAVKDSFKNIYTIELDEKLYKRAKRKFTKYKHIRVLQGDSGKVLKDILTKLNEQALFWLDAHYSGGITAGEKHSPIERELKKILSHRIKNHIILIDDAFNFTGGDYPTMKELESLVKKLRPRTTISVKYNVIIII